MKFIRTQKGNYINADKVIELIRGRENSNSIYALYDYNPNNGAEVRLVVGTFKTADAAQKYLDDLVKKLEG